MSIVNLIMENDPNWDGIPQMLKRILETRFIDNRKIYYSVSDRIRNDKDAFMAEILSIPSGSNIIGETNFHEDDTLEKVTMLLYVLKEREIQINGYFVLGNEKYDSMHEAIDVYLKMEFAYVTPEGLDAKAYKQRINSMFKEVTQFHTLFWMADEEHTMPIIY